MSRIYLISGPCGCGKTTFANAFSKQLDRQVYLIHGDDFHKGFVEPTNASAACMAWEDILRFNWDCILTIARKALLCGLDVIIDYVVEEELPQAERLAEEMGASLCYIVLTASARSIRQRLHERGDDWLIERALFLKSKLDAMPENQGHLLDTTSQTVRQTLELLEPEAYLLP